jgi:Domain of unknown function (DUF4394)
MRDRRWIACLGAAIAAVATLATPAHADRGLAVLTGNRIAVFDVANPTAITTHAITGLGASETVRGADLRAANGVVYAFTVVTGSAANSVVKTYTIDPGTGAAAFVGATPAALAGAGDIPSGWDVGPRVDRMRLVNTNDENARFNPDTGALAGNDTDLTPALTTTVIAAAYDRNLDGTGATLYVIDRNNSVLGLQGGVGASPSPNGGVVTDLGPLGITLDPASDGGLDIAPDGTFYAALTNNADDLTGLYRLNGAGLAVPLGAIGTGAEEAISLTILPDPPAPPGPPAPPPPADTTRPAVLVALAKTTLRLGALKSGLAYEFSCNEACTASATLSIRGRASAKLARGTTTLAAAGKGRIRIKTTKAGRRLVGGLRRAKRRRTKATLTTVVTDTAGNRTTVRKTLVLTR